MSIPQLTRLLFIGCYGPDVTSLQDALKIKDDGVFGSETEATVKSYQQANGLNVDGLVGPETWAKLFATPGAAPTQRDHTSPKPPMQWVKSPNYSSRSGQQITNIVIHHTDAPSLSGTVSWFQNPASQVSAHYVVDTDGSIVQMVEDDNKAWHCYGNNGYTLGIECVHQNSMGHITPSQEKSLIQLCKYLMAEYKISKDGVKKAHGQYPENIGQTECNGSLLGVDLTATAAWVEANL